MEYSIQELSRLSGVTTRTLRWYDQIGLLKPSRVAESGYRYYGRAEVDRLQDILYYRALGVELARIKECLDDPSFDRLAALRSHLTALEAERERLEKVIRSVKDTSERKKGMRSCAMNRNLRHSKSELWNTMRKPTERRSGPNTETKRWTRPTPR